MPIPSLSVMNHSYIETGLTLDSALDANARLDYTDARDRFTSVVALGNGGALPQIYGQSYNSIVVGLSNGGHSQVGASLSLVDNVEHIYLKNLNAGLYTIAVSSASNTSFGLAWNITAVPEPSSIVCLCLAGMFASARVLKTRRRPGNRKTRGNPVI